MKIEKIEIKGLFGKKDICWELNPQVNVLVGENGTGKSTILLSLYKLLCGLSIEKYINILFSYKVGFKDGNILTICSENELLEYLKPKLKTDISPKSLDYLRERLSKEEKIFFRDVNVKIEDLYVDLIEANLTNSNANHIIQRSNQKISNVLDMEIRDTIYEFNEIQSSKLITRLLGCLNTFFNQIDKEISYENGRLIYTDVKLQKTLNYSDLSSGERQLIYILLRVALSNGDKSKTAIILMDEPEISLHLNWQAHFIKQLTILNPDAQFIIVTHSPALIMNGWNDVYVDMAEITRDMEQAQ